MKKFGLLLGILAGLLLPVGPGALAAPSSMPEQISVTPGGGLGSAPYAIVSGMAPIMEKSLGVKVWNIPLEVVRDRYKGLMDGSIHVNLALTNNAALAMEGAEAYADEGWGPKSFSHVWRFFDHQWGFAVRRDSDIKSIYAIKGRKVAIGMHSSSNIQTIKALLAFANLKKEDVKLVPFGSWAATVRSLAERMVDVNVVAAESALTYEIEAAPSGLRILDMPFKDKEAWKRFLKVSPVAIPTVITKGAKSAQGAQGFSTPYCWVVYGGADEGFVYQLAKFAGEAYEEYKQVHQALQSGEASKEGQRSYLNTCGFAVHPGAVRYLKEIGMWTAKDEKRNQELLALEKDYQKAWKAALDEAKAKNIKVSVKNKPWMDLWDSYRTKLPRFGTRIE
jgi:TRAP transporter TAXI family solute receptor